MTGHLINRVLNRFGLDLRRVQGESYSRHVSHMEAVDALLSQELRIPNTPNRARFLVELLGTDPIQAMFLLHHLHAALEYDGEVCEFGVARGATSALIANELKHHAPERILWLYDSFAGLPPPSIEDDLIDDIFDLGEMAAYEGQMSVSKRQVLQRMAELQWDRFNIVPGFVTASTLLPAQVCFAYLDFDFYQPTLDVLRMLDSRLTGKVMVDDYRHFSSGIEAAVTEFDTPWQITTNPPGVAGFVVLTAFSAQG